MKEKLSTRIVANLLRPFSKVNRDEVFSVVLLTTNIFCLLTAYYVLKVVREPLILSGGEAEIKVYAALGQAFLLGFVVWGYDALGKSYGRVRLVAFVDLFFVANLIVFFVLGKMGVSIGIPFFLWVGVFNVVAIAQFWAVANDVYTAEQGDRLFAIVGGGAVVGSVAGAQIAGLLFEPLGPYALMLVGGGILLVSLLLTAVVLRAERWKPTDEAQGEDSQESKKHDPRTPLGDESSFRLMFSDRYLLLIAGLAIVLNWVNTTGEYILDRTLIEVAEKAVASEDGEAQTVSEFIGNFRAHFFTLVNVASVVIQLLLVSRIMRYAGVRVALFVLPVVALGAYSVMALLPILSLITAAKVAENSINYSLDNTARQSLFLITPQETKYKVKTAVDSLLWRGGDVLAAGLIGLGQLLALSTRQIIMFNIGLTVVWLGIVYGVGRIHKRRRRRIEAGRPAPRSGYAGARV